MKLHPRIKKVTLLSDINHQVNLLLSLQTFHDLVFKKTSESCQFRPSFTNILENFNDTPKSWCLEDVTSHKGTHI